MSENQNVHALPDHPNLEHLKHQAKRRLKELRAQDPETKLAVAQFDIAQHYGFSSWRSLKAHVDQIEEQHLENSGSKLVMEAISTGDADTISSYLKENPSQLNKGFLPLGQTMLHFACWAFHFGHQELGDWLQTCSTEHNAR